jgi:hypothetical protein
MVLHTYCCCCEDELLLRTSLYCCCCIRVDNGNRWGFPTRCRGRGSGGWRSSVSP